MKFSTVLTIFFYLVFSLNLKADNHSVLSISDNDFYIGSPDAPVTIIDPSYDDDDNRLITTIFNPYEAAEYLTWKRSRKSTQN